MNNKNHHKPKGKPVFLLGLLATITAIAIFIFFLLQGNRAGRDAVIRIPANADVVSVSDSLSRYLGADYASKVMGLARLMNADFANRHGAYLIKKGTNPLRAYRKLTSGAQQPVKITINGFRNRDEMVRKISAKLDFKPDSLQALLNDRDFMGKFDLAPSEAMALFLDDTYEVYWSASPREVVEKIGANYNAFWNEMRKDKARELGLEPSEIAIVASIADEETNKTDEKGTIGRLYINRLHKGMKLQSDPTVRFALNDFSIKRVKGNHLKVDSPYNTYMNKGLPPGPIRTTSKKTMETILDSAPNDYLYMCAKEDFSGSHNFAANFSEHSANAQRYRKALNLRGIN